MSRFRSTGIEQMGKGALKPAIPCRSLRRGTGAVKGDQISVEGM